MVMVAMAVSLIMPFAVRRIRLQLKPSENK